MKKQIVQADPAEKVLAPVPGILHKIRHALCKAYHSANTRSSVTLSPILALPTHPYTTFFKKKRKQAEK
ncbi:MAG TPA: hypothetical protein VF458_19895 [Ktedonobacteraceae bacterium]